MNFTVFIMTSVLILTLAAPIAIYFAIQFARKGELIIHKKIQNWSFLICVLGVLALEILIRYSGGSGSLSSKSAYYGTILFNTTLYSHITVAVLTYILWSILIIRSNKKFKISLPGTFSKTHKKLGYLIFIGLVYTGISALAVYVMTLNII